MSEPSTGMMVTSNVRLLRPLGEGGMGSVWVGEHLSLRTQVVVKFMANDLAQTPEALARFSREAAAASQVKSPHVVQMFDHGVTGSGAPYIVMELLEGCDLDQQIRASGRLDPREVVAIVLQLARALGKAHEQGIVHRDIKPSNVFLCDAGGGELFVKLLDFGIAKGLPGGARIGVAGSTTRSGSFVGSPFYMSPEQVIGAKVIDFKTDLWSLGVVAYEALTGERPFYAETVGALALKIHRDPIPVPSKTHPGLGPAVDLWFAKACAREPGERFPSAKELAEALAEAVTGVVETRSEGGASRGVASSERRMVGRGGTWMLLGAIAVVAAAGEWAVPRWMGKGAAPVASVRDLETASAPASASAPAPASAAASAPAAAPASASSVLTSGSIAPHPPRIKPLASAGSSATVPLGSAGVRVRPAPGGDDDIK